jgi:hypothetical protein
MQENQENTLLKVALFGLAIWGVDKIINYEPKDTVNYRLIHRGKIVYEGICFGDRINARINEHKKGGKISIITYVVV